MKVLVACEFSGVVRRAFRDRGHDAWSCDLLPSEDSSEYHYQGDVFGIIDRNWDMMIAHPPCTHLCVSGARWFKDKQEEQKEAINFFLSLAECGISRVCIENPVGIMSSVYRKPDQIIQPYEFGHVEAKKTCLWLQNLPKLIPTKIVEPEYTTFKSGKRMATWYSQAASLPKHERMKVRSKTFQGIADAMADQWNFNEE